MLNYTWSFELRANFIDMTPTAQKNIKAKIEILPRFELTD